MTKALQEFIARRRQREILRLLEGREETQRHDFKGAMPWRVKSFVKDILAMAKVQDGGYIIVGPDDGTWLRQGITREMEAMGFGLKSFAQALHRNGLIESRWDDDPADGLGEMVGAW